MSVNSKMTALANEIRELSGVTDKMGLNDMKNHVGEANTDVATEASLIAQIASALEGKASGGGGSDITTCTIEIVNETIGSLLESHIENIWVVTYENGELKGYGG